VRRIKRKKKIWDTWHTSVGHRRVSRSKTHLMSETTTN